MSSRLRVAQPRVAANRQPWDWFTARLSDPAPCVVCGEPALLRHPDTGKPQHKVCEPSTA